MDLDRISDKEPFDAVLLLRHLAWRVRQLEADLATSDAALVALTARVATLESRADDHEARLLVLEVNPPL